MRLPRCAYLKRASPTSRFWGPNRPISVWIDGFFDQYSLAIKGLSRSDPDNPTNFRTQETGIVCGDTEVTLTGETFAGGPVSGSDVIQTVGKDCD